MYRTIGLRKVVSPRRAVILSARSTEATSRAVFPSAVKSGGIASVTRRAGISSVTKPGGVASVIARLPASSDRATPMNLSRRARPFPHSDGLNASTAGRQRIHDVVAGRQRTSMTALASPHRHRHDLRHGLSWAEQVSAG